MSKVILMVVTAAIGMTACVSNQYQKPSNLRFQEKSLTNNQIVLVKRDEKLCSGDTATHQKQQQEQVLSEPEQESSAL
jgi:hypothetical protein